VPFAVIVFDFDPYLRLDLGAVRWETLGIAGAILLALIGAAVLARSTPSGEGRAAGAPREGRPQRDARPDGRDRLRRDDLLFIALGIVPGAVIGGRFGYALLHLDYYLGDPGAILDPEGGALQLSLAVVGGTIAGLYVARLLDAPAGRWLHVASLPLLLAIEGGKLAMAWGGTGQGRPADGDLATAYLGAGPWGSLAPSLPSVPSQLLEGIATGGVAVALAVLLAAGWFGRRDGRLFLVALVGWLIVRFAVATTWRDDAVLGPLCADQVISVVLIAVSLCLLAWTSRRPASPTPSPTGTDDLGWPDPDRAVHWREPGAEG
jgi:prolipoprotein diacylglyceryltransferase